ncbi:colanic acid biosynthesis glycosyltransferase WcaI [Acidobacteria bacterium AB60]|nr:colanic acid biosynthesis glycosyltransferase WcaI [Acidobacteria bacterium AB60]
MRILILSINYWPEETGIGAFTTYRAEYLASRGHDVTVCTTFPYYPEWKVPAAYAGKFILSQSRNGVHIARSRAYIPAKVTSVKRVIHEASFIASSLARALQQKRPDLLLVVSPPLGLAVNAFLLSRLWRIPYVFDVEDLQPDAAAELGMLPRPILNAMYRVEKMAYRNARLVSTITTGMQRRILEKGVPEEKTALFEPRSDASLSTISPDEGIAFRQKYSLGARILISHSGNMGVKQGLGVILDTAHLNRDDDSILFLIVGDGAVRGQIQQRARELQLSNILFLPLLDSTEFRGFLKASDICLVTQQKTVSDMVFPSKTVTYLAAGCPVIASVNRNSEVARTIEESGAGVVVEPEDPRALLSAVLKMKAGELVELGCKAREYASQRWSSERVLGFFETKLEEAAFPGRRA